MKKILTLLTAVALSLAIVSPANAWYRGGWGGGYGGWGYGGYGLYGGVMGSALIGGLIGGALGSTGWGTGYRTYGYYPTYRQQYYVPAPQYYAPQAVEVYEDYGW